MAKRKHAAALFEVINPGRPLNRPMRQRRPSLIKRIIRTTAAPVAMAGHAIRSTAGNVSLRASALTERSNLPARIPKPKVKVDRDHQLINFRLTYNTAIVAGFAAFVLIGMAYVVGVKMNHGPVAMTSSPSSAELKSRSAHPDVLQVGNRLSSSTELLTTPPLAAAQLTNEHTHTNPNTKSNEPVAALASDTDRVVGRQYVIVQTFSEESTARAAKAFLDQNKISTTIENGLASWASKGKFCLVGTQGFDHLRGNTDFEHYESTIERLGQKFSETTKARPFEPHAYRWKGQ